MTKYTKHQALTICERTLPSFVSVHGLATCRDCYHFDGRCELFGCRDNNKDKCYYFTWDISATNMVRKKILYDKDWCVRNWDFMCRVDRELFSAIYDSFVWKSR